MYESIRYAEPPVLPSIQATVQLRLQSTVQAQSDDNKAYFHISVILLSLYSLVQPQAFNHIINPVLIAVVP